MSILYIANEISKAVHDIGNTEAIAIKTASVNSSTKLQSIVAQASSVLFDTVVKEACDRINTEGPACFKTADFIIKSASALHKPAVDLDTRIKLAAVVVADQELTEAMHTVGSGKDFNKLAEIRSFGREYFVDILRRVL